jgi:hypothetical protein
VVSGLSRAHWWAAAREPTTPFHCDGFLVRGFGEAAIACDVISSEFVVRHSDHNALFLLFRLAYRLRDAPEVNAHDRQALAEALEWFDKNLRAPDRFNRSTSKGFYRRATRGIAWLRDSATDCASRMHRIKDIFEAHGHQVTMIRETRVGYIVYEDDLQVIAEPFADTQTGA